MEPTDCLETCDSALELQERLRGASELLRQQMICDTQNSLLLSGFWIEKIVNDTLTVYPFVNRFLRMRTFLR